jgi:hypothetical protein
LIKILIILIDKEQRLIPSPKNHQSDHKASAREISIRYGHLSTLHTISENSRTLKFEDFGFEEE